MNTDVTTHSASLETGCVTMTMTAGTTQMSGTVVSRSCIQAHFFEMFSVINNTHTHVTVLALFQSCRRVAQVLSSVTRVTVSLLLCSVMAGLIVRTCQMRPAVVSKLPEN